MRKSSPKRITPNLIYGASIKNGKERVKENDGSNTIGEACRAGRRHGVHDQSCRFNAYDSNVAAQFTLNTRYSITALQGKIYMDDIGEVVAAIYAADGIKDSGTSMPGTLLFTRSVQYTDDTNFQQVDWHGPTGITDTYLKLMLTGSLSTRPIPKLGWEAGLVVPCRIGSWRPFQISSSHLMIGGLRLLI